MVGGILLNFIPTPVTPPSKEPKPSSSKILPVKISPSGAGETGVAGGGVTLTTAPLIVHNGGYGKGKIKYYPKQENQFNSEVMLQELKPGGVYVLTINRKIDCPCNKELQRHNDRDGEGYWDSSSMKADNNGCIHTQLNIELPESSYDVKFFVKDIKNNWRVILKNDNLRFTIGEIGALGESKEASVVIVTNLQDGSEVGRETTMEGTASIPSGNHLWVLDRRVDFKPLWWPQREARIDPKTHKWSATVCFGGPQDINWDFHISVITVNADRHRELMDYWTKAMKTGDWKPIQIPETTSTPQIIKVKKVRH